MVKKCKICSNDAGKSQQTGLCSKHQMQYNRQRKIDGRSLSEFIKFMTMPIEDSKKKHTKITEDNAKEQKIYWQAVKEQEHALRLSRENQVRARELVLKTESDKAARLVLSAILKELESLTDIFPPLLEHKSAGDIRPIFVNQLDLTFEDIRGRLDELSK